MKTLQQSLNESLNEGSIVSKYQKYENFNPPVWFKDWGKIYHYNPKLTQYVSGYKKLQYTDILIMMRIAMKYKKASYPQDYACNTSNAEEWVNKQIKAYLKEQPSLECVPLTVVAGMLDDYINTQKDWKFIAEMCPYLCPDEGFKHIGVVVVDSQTAARVDDCVHILLTYDGKVTWTRIVPINNTKDINEVLNNKKLLEPALKAIFGDSWKKVKLIKQKSEITGIK